MNKTIEKIKDFLYDIIDYIIVIGVIVIVIGIIGWRLDILFADNIVKTPLISSEDTNENNDNDITLINENTSTDISESPKDNIETESLTQNDNQASQIDSNNSNKDTNLNNTQSTRIIVVDIPKGSLGPTIAEILLEKGLINNKSEFLSRAKELKLDTKLKAGSFKIESNSTLDNIIKIIAGVN